MTKEDNNNLPILNEENYIRLVSDAIEKQIANLPSIINKALERNLNPSSDVSVSAFIKLAELYGYSLVIRSDESTNMSIGEFNKLIKLYGCHIDLV